MTTDERGEPQCWAKKIKAACKVLIILSLTDLQSPFPHFGMNIISLKRFLLKKYIYFTHWATKTYFWLGWHISFPYQVACYDSYTINVKSVIVSQEDNDNNAVLITICRLKQKKCEICCIFSYQYYLRRVLFLLKFGTCYFPKGIMECLQLIKFN